MTEPTQTITDQETIERYLFFSTSRQAVQGFESLLKKTFEVYCDMDVDNGFEGEPPRVKEVLAAVGKAFEVHKMTCNKAMFDAIELKHEHLTPLRYSASVSWNNDNPTPKLNIALSDDQPVDAQH